MNDTLILNNNKYIISSTKILTTKKKLTTNFDKKYLNDAEVRARGEFKPHVFLAPFRHYRHLTFLHLPIAGKFAFVGLPHWPFLKPQALPVAIVTLSFPPWRCTTPQEASRCASPYYTLTLPTSTFPDFIISAASVDREEAQGWRWSCLP